MPVAMAQVSPGSPAARSVNLRGEPWWPDILRAHRSPVEFYNAMVTISNLLVGNRRRRLPVGQGRRMLGCQVRSGKQDGIMQTSVIHDESHARWLSPAAYRPAFGQLPSWARLQPDLGLRIILH
jgi:hypothetical protein